MIKLDKQVRVLHEAIDRIEAKIEELRDKYVGIEEKCWHEGRNMTDKERNKRYNILEQIEELEEELRYIGFALDYLKDYVD
jgi:chromosome segregation ATPase